MKNTIIIVLVIILLGVGGFFLLNGSSDETSYQPTDNQETSQQEQNQQDDQLIENQNEQQISEQRPQSVIGRSVEGRDIVAYHYGTGNTELLFIGGIHGGYSWNTSLVAYQMNSYLNENPQAVPENVKVTIIPVLNPDGLEIIAEDYRDINASQLASLTLEETIPGRFNANNVDLNRNFDCEWESTGTWQNRDVDGGSEPFSEPESNAIKNYVEGARPDAVVVWYSSAGGVYASSCNNGVSTETTALTNTYADASGYPAYQEFDFYEITGDMVNWLAKQNIPAISVLLSNHKSTEWEKNLDGIDAVLKAYSE